MADHERPKVDWPNVPGLFDGTEEEWRVEEQRRLAEVRAGRYVSHEAVMLWLDEWISTGKRGPRPQVGD